MDRLSALDASFLRIESDQQPMHVGSLMIFEGPAPTLEAFRSFLAGRLPAVKRYRQVIREVPLRLAEPRWEDYAAFDVDEHLRHTSLPAPGNEIQLRAMVARVMFHRLDRSRPLWEMWLVEGLEAGNWAVLSKVHHSMVDGIAGTDIMGLMLSRTPEIPEPLQDSWAPAPPMPGPDLMRAAMLERGQMTRDALLSTAASLREDPRATTLTWAAAAKGTWDLLPILPGQSTPFNAPAGRRRAWATARRPLSDIKAIRKACGGTVNDVVMTAITGGVRHLLLQRGLDPDEMPVRTMVPVSVRGADERGDLNNRIAAFFADLPVQIEDPVDCLHDLSEQMAYLKGSGQAVTASTLVSAANYAPAPLLSLGFKALSSASQTSVQMVTTNVPGPQFPLYLCGREMLHAYPYVPIGAHMTVSIGIFSYNGGVEFGINADGDVVPDAWVLAEGITATIDALRERAATGAGA